MTLLGPRRTFDRQPGVCEYDGRLSLVRHRGAFLLYARANTALKGGRFVQVSAPPPLLHLCCTSAAPPLRCTSAAPPLHLRCTSAAPPLHLRCTSVAPPLHLAQVASSVNLTTWGAFEPLKVAGYHPSHGNVYFWAAQVISARPLHSISTAAPLDLARISPRPA